MTFPTWQLDKYLFKIQWWFALMICRTLGRIPCSTFQNVISLTATFLMLPLSITGVLCSYDLTYSKLLHGKGWPYKSRLCLWNLIPKLRQLSCTPLTSTYLNHWYGLFILYWNSESLTYLQGKWQTVGTFGMGAHNLTSRHVYYIYITFKSCIKSVVFTRINS
jgi:hypothetical protein